MAESGQNKREMLYYIPCHAEVDGVIEDKYTNVKDGNDSNNK